MNQLTTLIDQDVSVSRNFAMPPSGRVTCRVVEERGESLVVEVRYVAVVPRNRVTPHAEEAAPSMEAWQREGLGAAESMVETLHAENAEPEAVGGVVAKPTLAVTGEAGAEAIVPLSPGGAAYAEEGLEGGAGEASLLEDIAPTEAAEEAADAAAEPCSQRRRHSVMKRRGESCGECGYGSE